MTIPQKAIVSFAFSALLCAGIVFFTYTGGFLDIVESRFYNPAVKETFIREAAMDAKILSDELSGLQDRFSALLRNATVRRSFLPNQESADVYERSMLVDSLLKSVPGIYSVRFIGSDNISVQEQAKINIDKAGEGVIFSFPFYDTFDACRGTALFAVSARALAERLASAGRVSAGESIALCAFPEGIVSGFPGTSRGVHEDLRAREALLATVSSVWAGRYQSVVPFFSTNVKLALVSVRMDQGFYYGRIVNESAFAFSQPAKILLLTAIFLTMFLTFFLFFNLKQRPPAEKNAVLSPGRFVSHSVNEKLEELETVKGEHGKGLLAAAAHMAAPPGDKATVILEQNGIPYINNDVFVVDKNTKEKLDDSFMKLIESVAKN